LFVCLVGWFVKGKCSTLLPVKYIVNLFHHLLTELPLLRYRPM
jgi:hypothetical protein